MKDFGPIRVAGDTRRSQGQDLHFCYIFLSGTLADPRGEQHAINVPERIKTTRRLLIAGLSIHSSQRLNQANYNQKKTMTMQTSLSCLILATIPIFTASAVHGAEHVGDFALLDQLGEHHSMRWYNDKKSVALLVHGLNSEATLSALPAYIKLKRQFTEQGVKFFLINPMGRLNRDAVQQEIATYTNDIPVLMDDSQKISEALGITHTGEVLLFDPMDFTVNYRGSVGPELEAALQAVISDEKIDAAEVAISGDSVEYPAKHSVSYEQDIAPILAANCAQCHRAGGIGPFALDSYTMAQGWSPMIREVLMTRRMPPGQIDPHVHEFSNDRNLAIADLQKLLSWIESGSPRDGATDPLAELDWPETEWTVPLGAPDLIVEVPPQTVPATGVLDWLDISVPVVGMDKDRWVKASEFIPGDTTVVHHSTVSLTPEGVRDPDVAVLTRYVPGQDPRVELPNTGGLMRKDSTLYVTMHYTTSGKETVDRSKYGIWFYPEDSVPEERMQSRMVGLFGNALPNIPPTKRTLKSLLLSRFEKMSMLSPIIRTCTFAASTCVCSPITLTAAVKS